MCHTLGHQLVKKVVLHFLRVGTQTRQATKEFAHLGRYSTYIIYILVLLGNSCFDMTVDFKFEVRYSTYVIYILVLLGNSCFDVTVDFKFEVKCYIKFEVKCDMKFEIKDYITSSDCGTYCTFCVAFPFLTGCPFLATWGFFFLPAVGMVCWKEETTNKFCCCCSASNAVEHFSNRSSEKWSRERQRREKRGLVLFW
jgi:hypothetical protein